MDRIQMDEEGGDIHGRISHTVIKISELLGNGVAHQSDFSYPWNICRVPPKLRRLHEHGFHPTVVAIGPLHHHCDFRPMEEHKLRFLVRILRKITIPPPDVQNQDGNSGKAVVEEEIVSKENSSDDQNGAICINSSTNDYVKKIEYLVIVMTELEAHARACYSETFSLSSSEFVMMMIMDSCFVVELLRLYAKLGSEYVKDPIFNTRWLVQSLKHDLIMLENQLPLRVLQKMFEMTTSSEDDWFTLTDLTLNFFNSLLPRDERANGGRNLTPKSPGPKSPNHLLGLFRSSFQVREPSRVFKYENHPSSFSSRVRVPLRHIDFAIKSFKTYFQKQPTDLDERRPTPPWVHDRKLLIHCVTELKEAGISFKKRENCELLDIKFKNGKLYIPPILIDDYTRLMFLNFVAYEQCNLSTEPYFTTYLLFLDSLLNSSRDVAHLHSKGIINHVLGSDEDVAKLFNMLCREVVHDDPTDCYLSKVLEDVNQYFGVRRHRWRAKWKHDYFSSPWAFISLIAAAVLLFFTFVQAFFAVFAYVKPPS